LKGAEFFAGLMAYRIVPMTLTLGGPYLFALFSFVEAFHHHAQADDDGQECQDSHQEPPEHARIILMAEIEYKLPKPGHLGLGHA
jgi:hypothetical protein